MVQIPPHMSSALDHPLERGGSVWGVWGKGEWLISWFKLKSGHYSNIHQLRLWLYNFKGENLKGYVSLVFSFSSREQLVNWTLSAQRLV